MKADEQLDYLINVVQTLLNGGDIDLDEFTSVCRDSEARAELKAIIEAEEAEA